jgi:hypothetical protein
LQLRLEFDGDVYVQEFIKTQFAGVQVHIEVLKLLKAVEPLFRQLKVEDEVKYTCFGRIQGTTWARGPRGWLRLCTRLPKGLMCW